MNIVSKEVKLNCAAGLNFPDIQESTHFSPQKQKNSTTKFRRKENQAEQTMSSALLDGPLMLRRGDQQVQYWLGSVVRVH